MALVNSTVFVDRQYGKRRGVLFDSKSPYLEVDKSLEDLGHFLSGEYKCDSCSDKCTCDRTRSDCFNIQLSPGVYKLCRRHYRHVTFTGNATQPNDCDAVLVFRPSRRNPIIWEDVTFDRVWVVVDVSALTDEGGHYPGIEIVGTVHGLSTSRVTITNQNVPEEDSTLPLLGAPSVTSLVVPSRTPGAEALHIGPQGSAFFYGINVVTVMGAPFTVIHNQGTLEMTAPDSEIGSGVVIYNDGGSASLLERSPNQTPVAQTVILSPELAGVSSFVLTTNPRVRFNQAQMDYRIGAGVSTFAEPVGNVDPLNGLSMDPLSGNWIVPVASDRALRVDRASGRVIDPNVGLTGEVIIDPITRQVLIPLNDIQSYKIVRTRPPVTVAATFVSQGPPRLGHAHPGPRGGFPQSGGAFPQGGGNPSQSPVPLFDQIEFIQCQFRNVSAPGASGLVPSVALTDTENYRFNLSNVVGITITGQRLSSNGTGPVFGTDHWGSLVTNGSTFLLYKTLSNNYSHTKYDGTIFYVDSEHGCGDLTITLPNAADWNGRVLKYKNISRGSVYIQNSVAFDGDECLGCRLELPRNASIKLQNRQGTYYILGGYHTSRRESTSRR